MWKYLIVFLLSAAAGCGTQAEAAWVRYVTADLTVTCLSSEQAQPCPELAGETLVDIEPELLTSLDQPGTCTVPIRTLQPFLVVSNLDPFTLGFVSPITCFRGQLVASVFDLQQMRAELEQEALGDFSALLGAFLAVRCGGASPPAGCGALQTRLQTGLPTVAAVNNALAAYDAALADLTP